MRIKLASKQRRKTQTNPSSKEQAQCCSQSAASASCAEPKREEQIRRKAYELFEKRGRQNGRDWEDWFEAEKVLLAK